MFARRLRGGGQREQRVGIESGGWGEGDDPRGAGRERSGLVDQQRGGGAQPLERCGILHEHAGLGPAADPRHERNRSRESERARTGDDEHRHGIQERVDETRFGADEEPDSKRHRGEHEHDRGEPRGDPIGEPRDRGLALLRLLNETDDLGEQRVTADPFRVEDERAGGVEGARTDAVLCSLGNRDGLASQHRFVDLRRTVRHATVDGNVLAGPDAKPIAGLHGLEGNIFLGAVRADAMRDLRGEAHQSPNGGVGPRVRPLFHDLTEQHDRGDESDGLEVERHAMRGLQSRGEMFAEHRGADAEQIRGAGAGDDQREHVRVTLANRFPPAAIERRSGPEEYRGRQDELNPGEVLRVEAMEKIRRDHRAHGESEDGEAQREGDPKSRPQVTLMR